MEMRQRNKALVNSRQISRPVVLIQLSYQSKSTVSLLYLLRPQRPISAPHNASLCGATQRRNSTLVQSLYSEIRSSSNKPHRERYCFMLLLCIEIL